METVFGVVATAALGMAGWAVLQVIKVPAIEKQVEHLVNRVDAIYDHLIGD